MKKILVAYLCLLIDLELAVNVGYFGLVLPVLAAGLLCSAFGVLANENEQFEQCILWVQGMAVLRVGFSLLDTVSSFALAQHYFVLLSIGVLVLFFIMTHRMLTTFHEIEQENHLFSASLFCMVGEICLCVIAIGCVWASASPTLGVNFFVLSFVASGLFLLTLYQLQTVYLRFEKMCSPK